MCKSNKQQDLQSCIVKLCSQSVIVQKLATTTTCILLINIDNLFAILQVLFVLQLEIVIDVNSIHTFQSHSYTEILTKPRQLPPFP